VAGRRSRLIVAVLCAVSVAAACNTEPNGHRVTVTPGVTVLRNGEAVPGDAIVCRALNGTAGAVVPDRGHGVANSAGLTVETDANGIVTASCAPSIPSS